MDYKNSLIRIEFFDSPHPMGKKIKALVIDKYIGIVHSDTRNYNADYYLAIDSKGDTHHVLCSKVNVVYANTNAS